jgi:hypothetical protein
MPLRMTSSPQLVIPAVRSDDQGPGRQIAARALASSLGRCIVNGRILLIRSDNSPLFKIARRDLEEFIFIPPPSPARKKVQANWNREGLAASIEILKSEPRQWVVVIDAASLVLRNIDHLIPPDPSGPYVAPEVDFYWAPAGSGSEASRGVWAVRGEHLPEVLALWAELEGGAPEGTSESAVWARVVDLLPLRKKRFESGEVVAPEMDAVDWETVSHSAVVTVPDWPAAEQSQFLQALFFGTYFGDGTGLMLQILDA